MKKVRGEASFKAINLEDWDCFGEGATASSYYHCTDDSLMLKLFASGIPEDEALREKRYSDALAEFGLSIPLAYDLVEAEGRYGVIYQRVKDKVSISRALANNLEDLPKLATLFAQECKKLHDTPCDTALFPSKSEEFKAVVQRSPFVDEDQRAVILQFLAEAEEETSCLHGDMHIGNMILAGEQQTPYWIDLAGFGYGNHFFDLGLMYYVLNVGDNEDACMHLYHNKPQTLKEFWKHFVPVYLGTDDAAAVAEFVQTCQAFAIPALLFIMEVSSPTPLFKKFGHNQKRQLDGLIEKL